MKDVNGRRYSVFIVNFEHVQHNTQLINLIFLFTNFEHV